MSDDLKPKDGWGDPLNPDKQDENNKLRAEFYDREVVDIVQTKKKGTTCYRTLTYIRIPVDDKTVVDRQMMPIDRVKWKKAWAVYKNNSYAEPEGVPIEQAPIIDKDMKFNLVSMGIDTVDAFTVLSDDNVASLGAGMVEAKYKLMDWMKTPEYTAKLAKQELQREGAKAIDELKTKMEAQQALINKLLNGGKPKGKRGRKSKFPKTDNQPTNEQVA